MESKVTVRVHVSVKLGPRFPPNLERHSECLRSQVEFHQFVRETEALPGFAELYHLGIISRVVPGRIPTEDYEAHMASELAKFIEQYHVSQEEWKRLLDASIDGQSEKIVEFSNQNGVPLGLLRRLVRFDANDTHDGRPRHYVSWQTQSVDSITLVRARNNDVDPTVREVIEDFVEKYGLDESDVSTMLKAAETIATPDLVRRFRCSQDEAKRFVEAVKQLHIGQTHFEDQIRWQDTLPSAQAVEENLIASVRIDEVGEPKIEPKQTFHKDLFRIDGELLELMKGRIIKAGWEVLNRIKFVNKRQDHLKQIVEALCQHQQDYLRTGDFIRLKPLTKSDLTRIIFGIPRLSADASKQERSLHHKRVGACQSTVSRLLASKRIDTPWGEKPLDFLCPSVRLVVYHLFEQYPDKNDYQISRLLSDEYGCKLSRRSVNNYRNERDVLFTLFETDPKMSDEKVREMYVKKYLGKKRFDLNDIADCRLLWHQRRRQQEQTAD